jgi:hypothetical protein
MKHAAAVILFLANVGCADLVATDLAYIERDEKRFLVSGKPDLVLSTFDGGIEIRSWDQPGVLVVVEKRGRDKEAVSSIEVRAEQSGDRIVIDARAPGADFRGWTASRSARLIVSLPAASDVRATSGDGSIAAERLNGRIELRSGDGSIRGRELAGTLHAQSGDGSIWVERSEGDLDVTTGDGSVTIEGRLSRLRARTGDGSLTITAAPGSNAAGAWDISTGDGSVTLEVPDGFGGELDARTGDGRILVQDVTVSNVTGRLDRNTLRGRIGDGGGGVRLHTGDGSITLRRR